MSTQCLLLTKLFSICSGALQQLFVWCLSTGAGPNATAGSSSAAAAAGGGSSSAAAAAATGSSSAAAAGSSSAAAAGGSTSRQQAHVGDKRTPGGAHAAGRPPAAQAGKVHLCRLCGVLDCNDPRGQRRREWPQQTQHHKENCRWCLMLDRGRKRAEGGDYSVLDELNALLAAKGHGWSVYKLSPNNPLYERYRPNTAATLQIG
jgi:hypothetical protein